MKPGLSPAEVVGAMENMDENAEKIDQLNQQIKAIKDDTNEMVKEYAKDWETKPKDIKKAYRQYLDMKKSDEESDFWELAALIEEGLDVEDPKDVGASDGSGVTLED
jgi:uncharacterized protein (UPF0335 family)